MVAEKYRYLKPTNYCEKEADKQFKYGFYCGYLLTIVWMIIIMFII
jgi:hypothetical protein